MVRDRRTALAGGLLVLALAGCGSGRHSSTQQQANSPAPAAPSTAQSTAPASTQPTRTPPAATSAAATRPPASTNTIPAHLCSGMDAAQNAADAYLGALSAGNAAEAMACVQPNTVPEALTRSLLATPGAAVAYLPREGVDGPTVFGYQGSGKLIDVTVGKQPDGQFRVTKVAVRSG